MSGGSDVKALVTGSCGFLGRHFVRALRRRGTEVRCVDVADREPWDARDYFRHATSRVDLAVHAAAIVGGRQKIEGAPLDLAVDLSLDAELFQWAMRTRPGRVVYISSSAAYPVSMQTDWCRKRGRRLVESDIDLDNIETPDLLYGWSKLTGELLARHAREAGVPVTVIRPFSGYGADQDECYPFRAFLERALRREDPFVVWGDGEQVRDFIHVDDVVEATLAAVDQGIDGPVNLGTGRPTSFNELASLVTRAAGYRPDLDHQTDQPVGVRFRVADPTLMQSFYQPRTSLETAVRMAVVEKVAV
jgi:nucleoside-diphosphate-sugar epimerase